MGRTKLDTLRNKLWLDWDEVLEEQQKDNILDLFKLEIKENEKNKYKC